MGLYRTIPQDVEAVQFGGMKDDEPILREMGPALPGWLWKAITKGQVAFDTAGVKVNGRVLKEEEWIIFDGVFVDSMDNEKFIGTFVPARKPLSEMSSAPKTLARRKAEVEPIPVPVQTAPVEETKVQIEPEVLPSVNIGVPQPEEIPDDVDAIMQRLNTNTVTETA